MNWNVFYTEKAETDLENIYSYIANTLCVPNTAKKLVGKIMEEVLNLRFMPLTYRPYPKEPWKSQGLRYFAVKNYLVFYIADEKKSEITIMRIMYGRMDIDNRLAQ